MNHTRDKNTKPTQKYTTQQTHTHTPKNVSNKLFDKLFVLVPTFHEYSSCE